MERLMSMAFEPMQERSVIGDAVSLARNHGVALSGTAASDNVSWGGPFLCPGAAKAAQLTGPFVHVVELCSRPH